MLKWIKKKFKNNFSRLIFPFCRGLGWVFTIGAILLCRTTTFGWNFNISTITWASSFPGAKSNIWSILMNQVNFGWFKTRFANLRKIFTNYFENSVKISSFQLLWKSCFLTGWTFLNQSETSIVLCQPIRDKDDAGWTCIFSDSLDILPNLILN